MRYWNCWILNRKFDNINNSLVVNDDYEENITVRSERVGLRYRWWFSLYVERSSGESRVVSASWQL